MKKLTLSLLFVGLMTTPVFADLSPEIAKLRDTLVPACFNINDINPINTWKWESNVRYIPSSTSEVSKSFIDKKSIKIDKKNKIITFWQITASSKYGQQKLAEEYGDGYSDYSHMKALRLFNYSKKQSLVKDYTNYNCDGTPYKEIKTGLNEWNNIAPDTVNEVDLNTIMKAYNLN